MSELSITELEIIKTALEKYDRSKRWFGDIGLTFECKNKTASVKFQYSRKAISSELRDLFCWLIVVVVIGVAVFFLQASKKESSGSSSVSLSVTKSLQVISEQ